MASIDFTTVDVWTKGGLTTFDLLFAMELKTRHVHFAGCTTNPNEAWMKMISFQLTNPCGQKNQPMLQHLLKRGFLEHGCQASRLG